VFKKDVGDLVGSFTVSRQILVVTGTQDGVTASANGLEFDTDSLLLVSYKSLDSHVRRSSSQRSLHI
jgi:hypothetical protein